MTTNPMDPGGRRLGLAVLGLAAIAVLLVAAFVLFGDSASDPESDSEGDAGVATADDSIADAGGRSAAQPAMTREEILKSVDASLEEPSDADSAPSMVGVDTGPTPIPDGAPPIRWPSDAGDPGEADPRFYSGDADPGFRQIVEPTRPPPDGGQ